MKHTISFILLLLFSMSTYSQVLNTKLLLDYCGYAILGDNSPEMRFTNLELIKMTTCQAYIMGVTDSLKSLKIALHQKNKANDTCYQKWLFQDVTAIQIVKAFYNYVNEDSAALKMPPDIAVTNAYTQNFSC